MSEPIEREDLLPSNSTAYERAQSQVFARMLDAPTAAVRDARDPDTAPQSLLGHLGWERSIHHPSDDPAVMRARAAGSFRDHLAYGTPDALEKEIALDLGKPVRVIEFNQDKALDWPDFALHVLTEPGENPPDLENARRCAIARKNVRDWPAKIRAEVLTPPGTHFYAGAAFMSIKARILSEPPALPRLYYGACARVIVKPRVLPL